MSALAAASPQTAGGSCEAYAAGLYERHRRAVFGLCLKQLRRREDADDAVQTTFIYALLSLRRGVVPELELPWLLTIARNVCSTRRRSGMRRGAYEAPQDLDSIQDKLPTPDRSDVATAEELTTALRGVPESQRTALLLREWRGLSYDEIGMELGLSQAATEALLFRARRNVAQRLGARAGVKTLHGLPLVSFLRNLLQSAVAKTVAVGAGAALTVVAVPADESTPHGAPPALPTVAHVDRGPAASSTSVPPRMPSGRTSASGDVGARSRAAVGSVRRHSGVAPARQTDVAAAAATPRPASSSAPTVPAPTAQTPSSPVSIATPPDDPAGSVVDTVSADVGQVVGDVPSIPAVTVQTPTVQLPIEAPSLPPVHLP